MLVLAHVYISRFPRSNFGLIKKTSTDWYHLAVRTGGSRGKGGMFHNVVPTEHVTNGTSGDAKRI